MRVDFDPNSSAIIEFNNTNKVERKEPPMPIGKEDINKPVYKVSLSEEVKERNMIRRGINIPVSNNIKEDEKNITEVQKVKNINTKV
jgi:hypothetical protein